MSADRLAEALRGFIAFFEGPEAMSAGPLIEQAEAALERHDATAADSLTREIMVLVQLREALGDPLGRLMQDELVQLARETVAERNRLRVDVAELLEMLQGVLKCQRGMLGHIFLEGWQEEAVRAAIAKALPLNAKVTGNDRR